MVTKPCGLSYCATSEEGHDASKNVLQVVPVVEGLLFSAAVYPLILMAKQDPALVMMMSLYVTLGIFLLLAFPNRSQHRSLIAFTACSSFVHAAVMSLQAFRNLIARGELIGSAVLVIIGVAPLSIWLRPSNQLNERWRSQPRQ